MSNIKSGVVSEPFYSLAELSITRESSFILRDWFCLRATQSAITRHWFVAGHAVWRHTPLTRCWSRGVTSANVMTRCWSRSVTSAHVNDSLLAAQCEVTRHRLAAAAQCDVGTRQWLATGRAVWSHTPPTRCCCAVWRRHTSWLATGRAVWSHTPPTRCCCAVWRRHTSWLATGRAVWSHTPLARCCHAIWRHTPRTRSWPRSVTSYGNYVT